MNRRIKGFTLVELLTVIAILGVLAAVAFPNMRDYMDRQRLVSQVRAISELAQFARSEAIKHSATGDADGIKFVTMTVSAPTPSTWFVGLTNGNASCSSAVTCVINQAGTPSSYYHSAADCAGCTSMTSHAAEAQVTFDPRGLVTTGGAIQEITLESPMGKQLALNISRLGRVSICAPGGAMKGFGSC